MTIREPELKTQVRILRDAIPNLKQQKAYDILAQLKGYSNWNTMSAAQNQTSKLNDYLVTFGGDGTWYDLSFQHITKVSLSESLELVIEAITRWIESTPTGSDLYIENGDSLTFDELQNAMVSEVNMREFVPFLATQGIIDFKFECVAVFSRWESRSMLESCCSTPNFNSGYPADVGPLGLTCYPLRTILKGDGEFFELKFNYHQPLDTAEIAETVTEAVSKWVQSTPAGKGVYFECHENLTFVELHRVLHRADGLASEFVEFMAKQGMTDFSMSVEALDYGTELLAAESCYDLSGLRGTAADAAFEQFEFKGWTVEATSGWEYCTPGVKWSRPVFLKRADAPEDSDTEQFTFTVTFKSATSTEIESVDDGMN